MAFKRLDGTFSIVALVNVRQGEFDCATIAADGSFKLARGLIVKDMAVDVYDLGVLPALMDVLVCFDEIVGFADFMHLVLV